MSVSVTKNEGVTVFTLTLDPQSAWPPLCQIFKSLCYSPVCCSVSQQLRRIQRSSQSALGTLQIMVGLLNLGFGGILLGSADAPWGHMYNFGMFPFWLGVLFIVFGIVCILSEKYPSPCLVILTVVLNLAGVVFAMIAFVLYVINITATSINRWDCDRDNDYNYWYERRHSTTTPSPERDFLKEKCLEAHHLAQMLLLGINGVLIVLSVLELCVVIISIMLGIMALMSREKESNKSTEEPEYYKPLLDEVTTVPGV